ncbi:uncharacterized protein LOC120219322 isoform X2 [Hibiscus syriacus]|uniref:uncharacterized protein LOC120219322 isoform X2 n=1 Tax=Hibiscus syriacus TaxID=106335 RepID=UPI001920FBFE|nr:uncharacterized protein LOC120219322 isoform X2 [Hibiscus syriacus]
MDPFPSIVKVFSFLIQEENQHSVKIVNPDTEATFAVRANHGNRYVPKNSSSNSKNSQTAHTNSIATSSDVAQQGSSLANECLKTQQCHQLIARLTAQLQAASTSENPSTSVNAAMQGEISSQINNFSLQLPKCWNVDSRASRHVCFSKAMFETLYPITGSSVVLSDKYVISVGFAGTVRFSSKLVLKDVLCP